MTNKEFEKLFLDLNSVLVKFWVEQGRPDKEIKIELLERMLNWYKKMGYVTLDAKSTSGSSEISKDLEEAADEYKQQVTEETKCHHNALTYAEGYEDALLLIPDAFIDGAKWDREEMLKDTVEGEITKDNRGNNVIRSGVFNNGFEIGDKVHVIVIPIKKL